MDSSSVGIPWLKIANVGKDGIDWSTSSYLPKKFWDSYKNYRLYKGDYVMALTRPILNHILKIAIVDKNAMLNQRVAKLIFATDSEYGYQLLHRRNVVDKIENELAGTDPPNLGSGNLKNINVSITLNKDEQIKIGSYLKKLDNLIALHQRKIKKFKQLKRAYLQALFPNEKEKSPKVRFANFEGDWEQRKVVDLSEETFGGGTPKTLINEYWNGEIPWIQSSDLKEHYVSGVFVNKTITKQGLQNSATKLIPKNSIAIVTRVGVGKIALMQFEYATSQDFLSLAYLKIDKWFGVYSLYNLLQKELNNVQGTSIKGITKNELLDKRISVPSNLEEQIKLGELLINIDNLLVLQQNKVQTLINLKSLYLQKMFC